MTDARAAEAARLLLEARRTGRGVPRLPETCRPRDFAEAYAIQDAVRASLGPIRGWKTGAPGVDAPAAFAPIFTVVDAPATFPPVTFPAATQRLFGIEAEVAFRLARDLAPRAAPWTRADVIPAIGSAHLAVELVDTRFADFASADGFEKFADFQSNAALVVGPAFTGWEAMELGRVPVRVIIDGKVAATTTGNSGGDPLRLLAELATHAGARTGGLKAGDAITTGSLMGVVFAHAGAEIVCDYGALGSVRVSFP